MLEVYCVQTSACGNHTAVEMRGLRPTVAEEFFSDVRILTHSLFTLCIPPTWGVVLCSADGVTVTVPMHATSFLASGVGTLRFTHALADTNTSRTENHNKSNIPHVNPSRGIR